MGDEMNLLINCTNDGVKTYPLHMHKDYEIMLYLSGNGFLRTNKKNYPFSHGTIIIVPPYIKHGSTSNYGFKNISVCGDFNHLFNFSEPISLNDNKKQEGEILAKMIFDNRYGNKNYLSSLSASYIYYILQNVQTENNIGICIRNIISEISNNAFDCNLDTTDILLKSGYAEDYIRSCFKKITEKTPIEFLTEIRIKHACFLIDTSKDTSSMAKIAEQCGFTDYVYFSKKFKSLVGISPSDYKKSCSL